MSKISLASHVGQTEGVGWRPIAVSFDIHTENLPPPASPMQRFILTSVPDAPNKAFQSDTN